MNLIQLIQDFESTDDGTRSVAEGQLREAVNKDPAALILACSQGLAQKDLTDILRHRACTLMESTLLHSINGTGISWKSFNDEIRQQIKTNLLSTVADLNDEIQELTTNAISLIFAADFRSEGWPELLNILNQTQQTPKTKKWAISALLKICDQLKRKQIILEKNTAELIFDVLSQGMQENETDDSVKLITAKALNMSLTLIKEVFIEEIAREKTWSFLLSLANSNNREIKICAFQCLQKYDVIRYNNETLRVFASDLWKITSTSLAEKDQELATLTIQIWESLAKEEKRKEEEEEEPEMKITPQVGKMLLPPLLQNLLEICASEGSESSLIDTTKSCLTSFARIMKDMFLQCSLVFIQGHLLSQNTGELRASLITFSCLLDCHSRQSLSEIVSQAIPVLMKILLDNNNLVVQEAASETLFKVAEEMLDIYFQEPLFSNSLEGLATAINTHPRVSINIVQLWERFGSHFLNQIRRNKEFSCDLTIVIDALIKNGWRDVEEEDEKMIDYTFPAAASLLRCISKPEVKNKYLQDLIQQMHKTRDVNGKRKESIQGGLLLCIQVVLQKFELQRGNKIGDEIFKILDDVSQSGNLLLSGMGLGVLCALIYALGPEFKPYFKGCWLWITQALSRCNRIDFFHSGLDAAVSLTEACPEEMKSNLGDIFTILITLLDKPDHNKSSKLRIISAIGDIALACPDLILPYVETLSRVYELSMKASVYNPTEKNSEITTEYLEQLRAILLDSYICLFHSVTDSSNPDLILASIPSVMEFLAISCSQNYHPTPAYLRTALSLVADAGLILKDKAKQYVKSDLTVYLIQSLSKFADNPDNASAIDYAKAILRDF